MELRNIGHCDIKSGTLYKYTIHVHYTRTLYTHTIYVHYTRTLYTYTIHVHYIVDYHVGDAHAVNRNGLPKHCLVHVEGEGEKKIELELS